MSSREIGDELFIRVKTVEAHREHIKQKLSLPSSAELLRYAIEFCRVEGFFEQAEHGGFNALKYGSWPDRGGWHGGIYSTAFYRRLKV